MSSRFDAVLFDLDGTLVDSAPVWRTSYVRLAAARGQVLADGWWETVAGRTMLASTVVFDHAVRSPAATGGPNDAGGPDDTGGPNDAGGPDDAPRPRPELIEPLVGFAVEQVSAEGIATLPGALPLAREIIAGGLSFGIVTSAWRAFAEATLTRLELPVSVLVTGDGGLPGKPDPAPYRVACERLGIAPERVLTIEDSPSGITSALDAGTQVLAVPSAPPLDAARPGVDDTLAVVPSLAGITLAQLDALMA